MPFFVDFYFPYEVLFPSSQSQVWLQILVFKRSIKYVYLRENALALQTPLLQRLLIFLIVTS